MGIARYILHERTSALFKRSLSLKTVVQSPSSVQIVEVGPRDGLQNESAFVTTEQKVHFIQKLHQAGLDHIEVGSFVSPKWVPSMADSMHVMKALNRWRMGGELSTNTNDQLTLSCLVPNIRGLKLALQAQADEIAIFASASEGFSQKNLNCSCDEAIQRFKVVVDQLPPETDVKIRGYVSCVIGCPYDGLILPSRVTEVTLQLLEMGCHQVSLGDTTGVGTPASVLTMLRDVQNALGVNDSTNDDKLAVHFHDTYGQGLANILVSMERNIRTIDASVAGLGGCPYAQGATGNVATEDAVYMLNGLGVETGVDVDKLVDAAEYICSVLGRETRSRAGRAIALKRPLKIND
ncbi:hypothetical protein MPSEU_000515600 [Mayamaea pseudoterrestris]|nr:hypothetical protein MPSEU_000515600 [Mayamaea pseudoterrestris]